MGNKRVVPVWVSVLLLAMTVLSMAFYAYLLFSGSGSSFGAVSTSVVLALLCDVFALLYCLTGYKKNSAFFFKLFVLSLYVAIAHNVYNRATLITADSVPDVKLISSLIGFAMFSVFFFAKDVGKKRSLIFALVALASRLVYSYVSISKIDFLSVLYTMGSCVYYIVFVLMIYAKYKDKEARGTK